ncbi:MAG TPA: hypothetical protein PKN96_12285 [Flavobacterium sp.]|uniref:hypothetical protein n=1 Tax=Flavobacterium sp. TaxID=239 RepID=UPI002CB2F479|nr:hypothetical protein [Flavobacterium sp.]HNP34062.1 hypothetical protein [Flavobacterium sp.]
MHIDIYHLKQFWKKPWVVDLILFLTICVCIYLTWRTSCPATGVDYNGFLLNLTTELIGVWLSVRIIDRLIKKRERLQDVRKNLLKNLRHPFDFIYRKHPYYEQKDVDYLENEMKWFDRRWDKRRSVFKLQEQDIARAIHSLNYELTRVISNVVIAERIHHNSPEEKKKLVDERLKVVDDTLVQLEKNIEKLILTFWETDNPDEI